MKKHSLLFGIALWALMVSLPSLAAAKDAVAAGVSNFELHTPAAVMVNGNPYSPGTFAVGTIHLLYQIEKAHLTANPLARFQLDLGIKPGPTTGQPTAYPVRFLTLRQTGSENVELSWSSGSFEVGDANWTAGPTITFSVPYAVAVAAQDGDELVGNLQLDAPGGSHLDTPTTIKVRILVVDAAGCLNVYNFITDQGQNEIITTAELNLGGPSNNRRVVSTKPGQLSNNILIVNYCGQDHTFDLNIELDTHFTINPHGNKLFTYLAGGYTDPSQFDIQWFGNGSGKGHNPWLSSLTVPAGSSFLATVHMGIADNLAPADLPANGKFAGFCAELLLPGSNTESLAPAIFFDMASPNPAETELGFTLKDDAAASQVQGKGKTK